MFAVFLLTTRWKRQWKVLWKQIKSKEEIISTTDGKTVLRSVIKIWPILKVSYFLFVVLQKRTKSNRFKRQKIFNVYFFLRTNKSNRKSKEKNKELVVFLTISFANVASRHLWLIDY